MSISTSAALNNVDLGAVASLVEAIRAQPDAAATTWVSGGSLDWRIPVRGPRPRVRSGGVG